MEFPSSLCHMTHAGTTGRRADRRAVVLCEADAVGIMQRDGTHLDDRRTSSAYPGIR